MHFAVGAKLSMVQQYVARQVMDIYDDEKDNLVEQEDLDRLQAPNQDPAVVHTIEPDFWFGNSTYIIQPIRFIMFSISCEVALIIFSARAGLLWRFFVWCVGPPSPGGSHGRGRGSDCDARARTAGHRHHSAVPGTTPRPGAPIWRPLGSTA